MQNRDEEFAAWPTDRGYVTIGRIDRRDPVALTVKLELQTTAPINARLAFLPPDPKAPGDSGVIFAAANDGNVFAMSGRGGLLWKFPAAEPVIEPPAVLDGRVFVSTQLGGLFCLDAKTGKQLWWRRASSSSSPPAVSGCTPRTASATRRFWTCEPGAAGRIGHGAAAVEVAQRADRSPLPGHGQRHGAVPP